MSPSGASTTVPTSIVKNGVAASIARPNILALKPYRCARDDYDKGILLDANENAMGPTSLPTNSLPDDNSLELERYPCPYQTQLKTAFANYRGGNMGAKNIFVGVGSDEAIDLLMRIFCEPGKDAIMITPPTYGMYRVSANINDVGIVEVPLTEDFELQIPEMLSALSDKVKLIFICSPGNPTCKAICLEDIIRVAESYHTGLVVVDEAYIDFSKESSAVRLVQTYKNIVVLQTLSKAFGLAGIRCGFAIAHDDVIQLMNNIKAPYNMNKLSSEVALNAIRNIHTLEKNVEILLQQRDIVRRELNQFDFVVKVYPSDSNFLLVKLDKLSKEIYKDMANSGIVVRYRGSEMHCNECLRITIGTEKENRACLDMLKKTYEKLSSSQSV